MSTEDDVSPKEEVPQKDFEGEEEEEDKNSHKGTEEEGQERSKGTTTQSGQEMVNIRTISATPIFHSAARGVADNCTLPDEVHEAASVESSQSQLEELEQEVRYSMTLQNLRRVWELLPSKDPDTVMWSVRVLEHSVKELELQLELLLKDENDEESEFKLRCEAQANLNDKLEEQIKWYNSEVMKMRERTKKGNEHKYDEDLDTMTEYELAQLVKQLERERNNLYGDLRNRSWLLDNHSKEYYHYKELIKTYTGDLHHINRSLEQIWRQRSKIKPFDCFSVSGATPMISPGLLNWNGESGIRPSHRIIDPKKGPVRKTAGVRSLPRLDQKDFEEYDVSENTSKKRTRSLGPSGPRTKSLEVKKERSSYSVPVGHRSADELDRDTLESSVTTSVEPASEFSEDMTIESFTSSVN